MGFNDRRRTHRPMLVAAKVVTARTYADCSYCPNKIRPGQHVTPDFDIAKDVHKGCYQRVNGGIMRANRDQDKEGVTPGI